MPFLSDHIKDICSGHLTTAIVGLDNLAQAVVVSSLAAEAIPPPPQFILYCVDGMWRPHISGLGLEPSFLVGKEPTEVTACSCPGNCSVFSTPPFLQLSFAVLLFLISTGCMYLVYNLGHNLISHFLAQIVPAQAIGCSFGVLLHQAAMSSSREGCVCAITSFTFWHHKMLWALLVYSLANCLEAAISLRNPNSSYCNVGSENRVSELATLMTLE